MKRNKTQLLRSLVAVAVIACAGLASCSQDDLPGQGEPLPEGKYPLMLTASVDGMKTRSTGKNTWTGDGTEDIGVRIGDDGIPAKYVIGIGNSVNPATDDQTLYWQNTTPATVTAWYPYEAQTDVNISNQKDGFADFDFLTASKTGQNYTQTVDLKFKHQMAKVSYTLQGEGVTNEELNTAVVTLLGDATATFENGVLASADQADGEITSCYEGDTRTGAALLVPQDMIDKPFIKVSIGGNTFTYTPTTDAAGILTAGKVNTYNITVKRTGLEVSEISASWNDDETQGEVQEPVFRITTVNGITLAAGNGCQLNDGEGGGIKLLSGGNVLKVTVSADTRTKILFPQGKYNIDSYEFAETGLYTYQLKVRSDITFTSISEEHQPQVGDFYYADGTYHSQLFMNATCIGIVFKVDAGENDAGNLYTPTLDGIQGYAVALHDVARFNIKWSLNDNVNCNTITSTTDYRGYSNTENIKNTNGYTASEYPVCWAATHFGDTDAKAPDGSSGWYLPSAAQMKDIARLWKDNNMISQRLQELSSYPFYQHEWLFPYMDAHGYATSTEHVDSPASHVYRISGKGAEYKEPKNYNQGNFAVRAVLTF